MNEQTNTNQPQNPIPPAAPDPQAFAQPAAPNLQKPMPGYPAGGFQNVPPMPAPGMNPTHRMASQAPPRPVAPITGAEQILSLVMLIMGFCFARFVISNAMGIYSTVFFLALTVISVIYLRVKEIHFTPGTVVGAVFLGLFSSIFVVNTNSFICFWATVFLIIGNAYLVFHAAGTTRGVERYLMQAVCKAIFEYGFLNMNNCFKKARRPAADGSLAPPERRSRNLGKNLLYILIGLVIAIPLTLLVAALLISADDNLRDLLSHIFDFSLEQVFTIFWQICLGAPVAIYMFSLLFSAGSHHNVTPYDEARYSTRVANGRFIPGMVVYSSVTPICILYLLFFFSQLRYFLSAFAGETADGMVYSAYARNGFFELCVLAVINLVVLLFMNYLSKQEDGKKPLAMRLFSAFICLSTLVIIASAFSKMYLYIDVYGLTQPRIYASWLMLLLAVVYLVILIKQCFPKIAVLKPCFYAFVVLFTALCFARTDALIVRYNVTQYAAGNLVEFDTDMLTKELSDDGLAEMLKYRDIIYKNDEVSLRFYVHRRQEDYADDYYEKLTYAGFLIAVQNLDELPS